MPKYSLISLLEWKRPEGSDTQAWWCKHYLEPVMGKPDVDGNYIKIVYDPLNTAIYPKNVFTAHHDTVHYTEGSQVVLRNGDEVYTPNSDCLGADCTTGCWLILGMIEAKVPGIYVIHAGEEIGCVGSSALVKRHPDWLSDAKAVISFDRKGTNSIITHQMGARTCSDDFAKSLSAALNMTQLKPDSTGSYTDSNEYRYTVDECTNVSVGYYGQHTKLETQNVFFAYQLLDALIKADWSKLVYVRDHKAAYDYDTAFVYGRRSRGWGSSLDWDEDWDNTYTEKVKTGYRDVNNWDDEDEQPYHKDYTSTFRSNVNNLQDIVKDFPEEIADILDDWGVEAEWLYNQLEVLYDERMEKKYGLRRH
jgi:hypothetical protein